LNLVKSFAKINPNNHPIPVVPLAHYSMGGIPTNSNCQVTYANEGGEIVIEDLLAIGEAACVSVHGANRMGCNSLLDIVVFGDLSGKIASDNIARKREFMDFDSIVEGKISRIKNILSKEYNSKFDSSEIKYSLRENMRKHAGIYREEELLRKGLMNIKQLTEDFKKVGLKNKSLFFNDELIS
jgi:succinate dehydrogenase / fumarate reductase flavoprotein subunit